MNSNKFAFFLISICILILNTFFLIDFNNSTKYLQNSFELINLKEDNENSILAFLRNKVSFFKKKPLINPHDYDYVINPKFSICSQNKGKHLTLIIFVLSSRNHFQQRELIRQTWSNQTLFPQMRVVFLIGSNPVDDLKEKIKNESLKYGDLVQETFQDSYLNLTLKSVMGMKWVSNYCSNAKYALKVDDDVVVNPFILLPYLEKLNDTTNSLQCYMHVNATIHRTPTSKFYVSYEELNLEHYVKYCDGPAYAFPGKLASQLFSTAQSIKHFKFEDVFFGLLADRLQLNFTNLVEKYSFEPKFYQLKNVNYLKSKFYFYPCKREIFLYIWSNLSN